MKKIVKPFPNFARFILINLVIGFLITILFTHNFLGESWQMIILGSLWSGTISLTQWLGHAYIGIKLDEKYDIIKETKKRILLGSLFIALYSAIAFAIVQVLLIYLAGGDPTAAILSVRARESSDDGWGGARIK